MKKIAVFGAGGFGREVKMLIDQINQEKAIYEFIGYFDDGEEKNKVINGFPVLGGVNDLNYINFPLQVVFAIGNPVKKKKIIEKIHNSNLQFPRLMHPSVLIGDDDVRVGEGSIICAGTIITVNINIGKHVILNLHCTVGHDTIIGDFSSFMPTVNISGEVNIKECVYAGTGAKIINQLEIGENTIIGSGAVVSKSLPANCTAVGVPAKPIKFH
jgi:sugar O-acyltransferase (sialic acid O-acetyltransferase NeuD family)